mgnify:CR=1 FL=1
MPSRSGNSDARFMPARFSASLSAKHEPRGMTHFLSGGLPGLIWCPVDGEQAALHGNSRGEMRRIKRHYVMFGGPFLRIRINYVGAGSTVQGCIGLHAVDQPRWLDREKSGDKRTFRPIKQARLHPMMLCHGSEIPVVAQVRTRKGCDMRTHLALKTQKHFELFGLFKREVGAGVHVVSSTIAWRVPGPATTGAREPIQTISTQPSGSTVWWYLPIPLSILWVQRQTRRSANNLGGRISRYQEIGRRLSVLVVSRMLSEFRSCGPTMFRPIRIRAGSAHSCPYNTPLRFVDHTA